MKRGFFYFTPNFFGGVVSVIDLLFNVTWVTSVYDKVTIMWPSHCH